MSIAFNKSFRFIDIKEFFPQAFLNLGPILFLLAQNLVIFRNHYFNDFGFPWDFSQAYYALTAFWTTIVSQGVYPTWTPFSSMGMPFNLILQSGLHYPPLWIFPLLKIEYSLPAAVVFQCLHVLFGAIGMYFFLRLALRTNRHTSAYAFLGAFVFQFFGGFYSNAQHVDIIRAFSIAPWLFYLFSVSHTDLPRISWRLCFIPLSILLVTTGLYPGNIISSIVVIGLYFLCQSVDLWLRGIKLSTILGVSFFIVFMIILGFGLSVFHLGPVWAYQDYLFRAEQIGKMSYMSLGIEHLPAFFLDNALVPGEISMTSTFLTLPALILLSYIPLSIVKRQWPMAVVVVFSLLMAAGERSFFWFLLTKFSDVFLLSRFPISDYRVFVAIGLIYFSILATKALVEDKISWKSFLFRTGIVFLWFSQGVYVSYPILRSKPVYIAIAVCLASILCVSILVFYKKNLKFKRVFIIIPLLVIISWDAARVLPQMGTWQLPSSKYLYQIFNWPLERNGQLLTSEIIQNTPSKRPARIKKENLMDYSWEGYITGRYTLNAFESPNMLKKASSVLEHPTYKKFMLREWMPLFFEYPEYLPDENNIKISPELVKSTFHLATTDANLIHVRQIYYGINKIEYIVKIKTPVLMVENEMYFPGWSAILESGQGISEIRAVSVNNLFRAWLLPAGSYKMVAQFELPYTRVFIGISAAALIIWILLLYYFVKQKSELTSDLPPKRSL